MNDTSHGDTNPRREPKRVNRLFGFFRKQRPSNDPVPEPKSRPTKVKESSDTRDVM